MVLGLVAYAYRSARNVGAVASAPYLTVFMVDGLSESVFAAELEAGRLPNIAALAARGARVEHGISSFPSMTSYGFHPFLTGQDAARRFQHILREYQLPSTIRQRRGIDIAAGCGQLATTAP